MPTPPPPSLSVPAAEGPLPLSAPAWEQVPAHALTLDAGQIDAGGGLIETGRFRLALAGGSLWLRVDFDDRDVVQTAADDGDELYKAGDVAEWFIGLPPEADASGTLQPASYLELHLAPNGARTAVRIDRPGLYETFFPVPFRGEVSVDGTLNDASNEDRGWSAVMELPLAEIAALLPGFDADHPAATPLSVLVSRYNYGRFFGYDDAGNSGPELSMWPTQPRTAFHLRPFHAPLRFPPPAE